MKNKYFIVVFIGLLINGATAFSQVPNGLFENWTTDVDGNINPDGWETMNSFPTVFVSQYTPAYSGNYSLRAAAVNLGITTLAGTAIATFPFTLRPSGLSVCVKATVMPGDWAYVTYTAWAGGNAIASPDSCAFKCDSNVTVFTCITIPISYSTSQTPDSVTIIVAGGNFGAAQAGTEIIVDEMSFTTGIEENEKAILQQSYPNPTTDKMNIPVQLKKSSDVTISVYDLQSREVKKLDLGFLSAGSHDIELSLRELPNGIYGFLVKGDEFSLPGNFAIQR